jgi:hypothetical protein
VRSTSDGGEKEMAMSALSSGIPGRVPAVSQNPGIARYPAPSPERNRGRLANSAGHLAKLLSTISLYLARSGTT